MYQGSEIDIPLSLEEMEQLGTINDDEASLCEVELKEDVILPKASSKVRIFLLLS